MGEDYIAHYGTPNQKWHQRNYQYPDGTYTELGKARRRVGTGERKPLLTEQEKLQRRENYYNKKEAIRNGDIVYANEHISEFSNEELDDVIDRYYKNKKISEITAEIQSKDSFSIEKFAKKLGTYSDIAGSTANIFKSVNTIDRSLNDMSKRRKGKDDDRKDNKKDNKGKDKNKNKKKGFPW